MASTSRASTPPRAMESAARTKRIVHMSSVHAPYDTRIFLKECRTLASAGYDVTYVVANPAIAERDGVKFISVEPSKSRLKRMLKTARDVYKVSVKLNADLYHFHDPELVPWGILLRLRGKKVVMDVHEEAANDIIDKDYIPKRLRGFVAWSFNAVEKIGAAFFNGVVASRPSLMEHFPKNKTILANNFPILGELETPGSLPFDQRPKIGAYVGGLNEIRGFYNIINGLGALPADYKFELHVAGGISPESLLEDAKNMPGFDRIKFLGMCSRSEVADLLGRARFGLVFFKPIANHLNSFPTKLFEYASAGLPTLGTDMPHWRKIIQDDGFGFCVDIEDPKAVAERIMHMADNPAESQAVGQHALEAVKTRYNWDIEGANLVGLYEKILA